MFLESRFNRNGVFGFKCKKCFFYFIEIRRVFRVYFFVGIDVDGCRGFF